MLGEVSETEHFVEGGGGGRMGKRGRTETRSRPRDPGTKREESSLPSRTAACELPNGKGAGKRHQIGKCYPVAYGFRAEGRLSEWKLLTAPWLPEPREARTSLVTLPGLEPGACSKGKAVIS